MTDSVIIPVSPIAILGPAGYYSGDPVKKRRKILVDLVEQYSYKDVISRLNATATRLKNTQPRLSQNLKSDMLYLKKIFRPEYL